MKRGIKTFILPMQDKEASIFMNNKDIVVTLKERHFAPKEGLLYLYIEYDDFAPEGEDYEDCDEGGCLLNDT